MLEGDILHSPYWWLLLVVLISLMMFRLSHKKVFFIPLDLATHVASRTPIASAMPESAAPYSLRFSWKLELVTMAMPALE